MEKNLEFIGKNLELIGKILNTLEKILKSLDNSMFNDYPPPRFNDKWTKNLELIGKLNLNSLARVLEFIGQGPVI